MKEATALSPTPNAVLSFLDPGDDVPQDAVIVSKAPQLENGQLS